MNPEELKFLELLVAAKGDIEVAKVDFESVIVGRLSAVLAEDDDTELKAVIAETAKRKIKNLLPAIGNSFIAAGRSLGGKVKIHAKAEA